MQQPRICDHMGLGTLVPTQGVTPKAQWRAFEDEKTHVLYPTYMLPGDLRHLRCKGTNGAVDAVLGFRPPPHLG